MSLAQLIRDAVALADDVTKTVHADVTHEAWTGMDAQTKPTYATGVVRKALVEQGPAPFRNALGETIVVKAIIRVLRPIDANGATNRQEPIDPRDRFTLPNGETGSPIEAAPELIATDPVTNVPYYHVIGLA